VEKVGCTIQTVFRDTFWDIWGVCGEIAVKKITTVTRKKTKLKVTDDKLDCQHQHRHRYLVTEVSSADGAGCLGLI